jgi:biopolymer transport protein ExbD
MRGVVVVAVVAVCVLVGTGRSVCVADEGDRLPVSGEIPGKLLGVVEAADPDILQEQIMEFVDAVQPGMGGGWSLRKQLGRQLARTRQVAADAPMRILLVREDEELPRFVTVFQPAGGTDYIEQLREKMTLKSEEDGVHLFTYEQQEFDAEGFQAAAPEDRQNVQDFMQAVDKPFAAKVVGDLACAGRRAGAVAVAAEFLEEGAITEKPLLAGGGAANAIVRVGALAEVLAPQTEKLREFFRRSMLMQGGGDEAYAEKKVKSMDVQIEAVLALCRQIEELRVGFDAGAERMRYAMGIDPVPGSGLEAYLRSVPEGVPEVMEQLPAEAFAFVGMRIGNVEQFAGSWTDYAVRMMEAWQGPEDTGGEYRKNVAALMKSVGDQWAFAMQGGLPMRGFQVMRFESAAAAERSLPAAVDMASKAPGFGYGMKVEQTTHAGHPVAVWRMRFDQIQEAAGGGNLPAGGGQMQKKMLGKMFGEEGWVQHTVVRGRDWITQMGVQEAEGNRWAEIDRILQGDYERLTADAGMEQLIADLPEEAGGVFFLRLTGLANWQLEMARAANPMMAAMMPEVGFDAGPGMSGHVRMAEDGARVLCRIPSREVKAVVDGFKNAMQKRRRAAQPQDPDKPRARPQVREPEQKVIVRVGPNDRYVIGDEVLTFEALDKRLYELGEKEEPIKLIVTAPREIEYEKMVKVMNLAKAAGIKWISLAVEQEGEQAE